MKITLIYALLFLSFSVFGQDELHQLMTDFDLSPSIKKTEFIKNAPRFLRSKSEDSVLAELCLRLGIANGMQGNADSSMYYFNLARAKSVDSQYLLKGSSLNGIGNVLKHTGKTNEALESFLSALKYVENRNDKKSELFEGDVIGNIAGIYYSLEDDLEKAEMYTKRALVIAEKYNQQSGMAFSYVRLALIYNRQGKYEAAVSYHQKASEILAQEEDYFLRNYNLVNLAKLYVIKEDFDSALAIYNSLVSEENADSEVRGMAMENAAKIQYDLGNYDESIRLAEMLKGFSQKNQTLPTQAESMRWLYKSHQALGQYKSANEYMNQYVMLNDSLRSVESVKVLSELETKYETEKKEQEITQLKLQNQQAINQRNIYLFVVGTVVLGLIFLVTLVRSKTKSNRLITQSLNEKETLLREIHHRVKNNLQVISSLLSLQARYIDDAQVQQAVNEGQNRVKSMALIHQKLYQRDNLSGVEALDYIQNLTANLRSTYGINSDEIDVSYDIQNLHIDVDTIIPMGLILNELISNAFKYAFPAGSKGALQIGLNEANQQLVMSVKDNGVGLQKDIENTDSFGIRMIKSLAMKLEATVTFNSNHGTEAILSISNYKLMQ